MELASPPATIAAALLSGNPLAEPASIDAEMSANEDPAPLMMEQETDHSMGTTTTITLPLLPLPWEWTPLRSSLNKCILAVPVWHIIIPAVISFFCFCFLSLCSILLVLYLGDRALVWKGGVWGSCKVYGLCFILPCLFVMLASPHDANTYIYIVCALPVSGRDFTCVNIDYWTIYSVRLS